MAVASRAAATAATWARGAETILPAHHGILPELFTIGLYIYEISFVSYVQ